MNMLCIALVSHRVSELPHAWSVRSVPVGRPDQCREHGRHRGARRMTWAPAMTQAGTPVLCRLVGNLRL